MKLLKVANPSVSTLDRFVEETVITLQTLLVCFMLIHFDIDEVRLYYITSFLTPLLPRNVTSPRTVQTNQTKKTVQTVTLNRASVVTSTSLTPGSTGHVTQDLQPVLALGQFGTTPSTAQTDTTCTQKLATLNGKEIRLSFLHQCSR